jgi:hypothetical protein
MLLTSLFAPDTVRPEGHCLLREQNNAQKGRSQRTGRNRVKKKTED